MTVPASSAAGHRSIVAAPIGSGPMARIFHSAIHYREFRVLWLGLMASFVAFNMQITAFGYVAYQLSGSALAIGGIWLVWGGSQLVLSLFGGALADRLPKREVLRVTQGVLGISSLALAILLGTGLAELWHLFVVGFIQGTVFAFNGPARQSFLPLVVPRERVTNAVALNNGGNNIAAAAAPAVAGVLLATPGLGPAAVFYVMAGLYLVVQLSLMFVRDRGVTEQVGARRPILREVADGIRFVTSSPILSRIMLLALAPILLGSGMAIVLPSYTTVHLGADALVLGFLFTGLGVGAVIGSLAIAYFSQVRRRGLLQLLLGLGLACGLLIAGFSPWIPLSILAVTMVGAFQNAYLTANNALLLMNAPADLYGRIMSLTMIMFSLTGFAAIPYGALTDWLGAGTTFILAGTALLAIMLSVLVTSSMIRNLAVGPSAASSEG